MRFVLQVKQVLWFFYRLTQIILFFIFMMTCCIGKSQELNLYLRFLFELIVSRGPDVGFDVSLTRYDLFHGHLFLAKDTGRLGIL